MGDNNSVNIVFRRDGIKYKYSKIAKSEDGNVIPVDLEILRRIVNRQIKNISRYYEKDQDALTFKITGETLDYLMDIYKEKYPKKSDSELRKAIIEEIELAFQNIDYLACVKEGNITSIKINYRERFKEINDNEVSSGVNYADVIEDIDMSKINPLDVINTVKEKVIAQDKAVDTIVYNIYNNQKILDSDNPDLLQSKANIILDGPTGTGKTFILKETAKNLSLPINIVPADMFSAPGYKGAQLEEMIIPLLDQTGGNIELAERGIIVLDEFDKLCVSGSNSLEMHKAIQHSLLTYIGGTRVSFEYKGKTVNFDTSKITFICLGAFTNLRERKIQEELSEDNTYIIKPEDYVKAGLEKELVGRISLVTATQALSREDFIRILKESKASPIKNLVEVGKMYGKEIIYSDDLIEKIADEAYTLNTGARSLQTIVNGIEDVILPDLVSNPNVTTISLDGRHLDKYKEVYIRRAA